MEKKNTKNRAMQRAEQVVDCYVGRAQQSCDPLGSWTGKPRDEHEVPVQDADDL